MKFSGYVAKTVVQFGRLDNRAGWNDTIIMDSFYVFCAKNA